ncbi:MAG: pilus assembly protein PilM [Planctomycetia bacterium]|nr:pilus assembly protein PilM [Planctomycetia bacterium]
MSEILAVEWEHAYVSGVVAQVSPGRVRVTRTFVIPRPTTSGSASGTLQIDWLKPELGRQGIPAGPTLVALPRDEAIVKRLDLPEVTDDELPVIVRFQAGAKSSVGLDELSLDFLPLPRRSEIPGREVLLATVPKLTLDEVTTVCHAAGLETKVIGLTAAAVAEFVARAEGAVEQPAGNASLVVARHGYRIEISVLRRSHLLFSHSSRLPDGASGQEAQAIVAEVSRALVALRGTGTEVKIERVWTLVSAAEHEQLAESLHRRLSCEVRPLDPLSAVECDAGVVAATTDRALFAGPIGMLLSRYDARVPAIDFLSPRRPPVKRDSRKRQLVLAGAGAATVVALLAFFQWQRIKRLDDEIADRNAKENQLNEKLNLLKPTTEAAGQVAKWESASPDWLDELVELTDRMPATEKVYLSSIDFRPRNGTQPPVIHVEGVARDRTEAMALNPLFARDEHFQGIPNKKDVAAPKEVQHYTWAFDKDLRLLPAPPKKTAPAAAGAHDKKAAPATPPADAPSAKTPSSAAAGGSSGRASS